MSRKDLIHIRLGALKNFLKHKLRLLKDGKKIIENSMIIPLPDCNQKSNTVVYNYYWFAEGLQYYGLSLEQLGGWIDDKKYKLLGSNIMWGFVSLTFDFETYFEKQLKSAERALIRKALKNGYTVREICYDDFMEDIVKINKSKVERMGHGMTDEYLHPVKREAITKPYSAGLHTFGCFDSDHNLVAYYIFEKFSNILHTMYGIGHAEHLNMGIMNYLFAFSVSELSKYYPGLNLFYGLYDPNSGIGLMRFKKNVGCMAYRIVYEGTNEQFKFLKEFNQKYILHNDSAVNLVKEYFTK